MPDEGLRFEAWSMPHVGTLTRKFDFSKWVESYVINDRFNDLCEGKLYVPDDFPLKAELFNVDEANHANDVGSMVRVLRGTTPILHYIVTRTADHWSDKDPTEEITVEGLEWLLDRATVPHYDHPADPTVDPDWIYGADTILQNAGLESSPASIEVQTFRHTQAAGTYTITYSGQTTTALAFNADWFAVANALEALSNIQDVTVSGAGTAASPFEIEFLDPSGNVVLMTSTATGAVFQEVIAGGMLDPAGWTTSYNPSTGQPHGTYTIFEVSTLQAQTGIASLRVNAGPVSAAAEYPGVQQISNVTGGRTYRAEVWIRPTFSSTFRLVIRTMDETWIAQSAGDGTALTANVWTKLTVDPFIVPEHISQVIFRVGLIDSTDRGDWFVDNAVLAPGFPEATLGKIMSDLRTAALAQGVLAWLTPTWSTTLDSDGVAWDRNLKWYVNHDQTFMQLFEYARRWNYEFRIRWDVADNRFEWDMWNPAGGGQTRTGIAITGKSGVAGSGPIVKHPPDFTYMRVEGERGRWGEFASTTLDDVWGRLEKTQGDRQGVESTELDQFATRLVTRSQDRTGSRSIQVEDPSILPWLAYEPGDIVTLNLAPKDTKRALRIAAIAASMSGGTATPTYEVHFTSPVYTNDAAMAQGLRTLMRKFDALRLTPASTPPVPVPGCCPSCPAHATGVISGTTASGTIDWTITDDQDHLLAPLTGSRLEIIKPGLYSIQVGVRFQYTRTAAGWCKWMFSSVVSGNDAPRAIRTVVDAGSATSGTSDIRLDMNQWGHTENPGQDYDFFYSFIAEQSAGLVSTGTPPTIPECELMITRHSDGCAEERICG